MYRHRKKCHMYLALNNYSDTVEKLAFMKDKVATLEKTVQQLTSQLDKMTIENKNLTNRLIDTLENERQVKNKRLGKTG